MKKTIAKIMAAAMVLSTVASAGVVNAATPGYGTHDWTINYPGYFTKDAVVTVTDKFDTDKMYYRNNTWDFTASKKNYGMYSDTTFVVDDDTDFFFSNSMLTSLAAGVQTDAMYDGLYTDADVTMTGWFADSAVNTSDSYTFDAKVNQSVTPVEAKSNVLFTRDEKLIQPVMSHTTTGYAKGEATVTAGTYTDPAKYKDVVVDAFKSRDYVQLQTRFVAGRGWVTSPWFDLTNASSYEIIRQLVAGNAILVPMARTVRVNGVTFDTGRTFWAWFWGPNYTAYTDNYWNAIVKLKANNNRYTPIRVHVDANEKSIAGNNLGLYVQVVNGTVYPLGTVVGTSAIATVSSISDQRLEVKDVHPDDYALLKSDAAKGKNLMLDEAYLFDVRGVLNNNSLVGAGAQYYDFGTLGQNTDLGTVAIGKIDTIHARIFKECKEKLISAKYIKFINNGAFRKNKQLKKAIIGDKKNVKKINEKAFYDCKKLTTVKLSGKTLKHVGKNAFGGSTDKKSLVIKIKGNKTQFNKAVKLFKKSGVKKAKFKRYS